MLTRFLMMFSVIVLLGACSTTEDETIIDEQPVVEREVISDTTFDDGNTAVVNNGPLAGTQEDLVVNVGDRVFFGTDRYDLAQQAQTLLNAQAQWLNQYSNLSITIEGHADERGTREYNLALGERRANAVKNYLTALGVNPLRINVVSFGKERPAMPGSNPSAWAQNRRGVTKVD